MYSDEVLRNNIYSKLVGEGGLATDFAPDSVCVSGSYENKPANIVPQQILTRILSDDTFFDQIADKIIAKYYEVCKLRNISPEKSFDRVMTSLQCCHLACFFGQQIIAQEFSTSDKRGR